MSTIPVALLVIAAVVGIIGIAFAITDAVRGNRRRNAQPEEQARWGHELGFRPNDDAVLATVAQWSHGPAAEEELNPQDGVSGEFAGHPVVIFANDDALIVAVQRDTASDVVVEIHPQDVPQIEQDVPQMDKEIAGSKATNLQVYSSDVDAMIRATDDRLVGLLDEHPDNLAMAWSEGYWAAAVLPLGDDGVDRESNPDIMINQQLPYVLNWLANLNDALRVLPPRAGEEENIELQGVNPSRPSVDRTSEDHVPADADVFEPADAGLLAGASQVSEVSAVSEEAAGDEDPLEDQKFTSIDPDDHPMTPVEKAGIIAAAGTIGLAAVTDTTAFGVDEAADDALADQSAEDAGADKSAAAGAADGVDTAQMDVLADSDDESAEPVESVEPTAAEFTPAEDGEDAEADEVDAEPQASRPILTVVPDAPAEAVTTTGEIRTEEDLFSSNWSDAQPVRTADLKLDKESDGVDFVTEADFAEAERLFNETDVEKTAVPQAADLDSEAKIELDNEGTIYGEPPVASEADLDADAFSSGTSTFGNAADADEDEQDYAEEAAAKAPADVDAEAGAGTDDGEADSADEPANDEPAADESQSLNAESPTGENPLAAVVTHDTAAASAAQFAQESEPGTVTAFDTTTDTVTTVAADEPVDTIDEAPVETPAVDEPVAETPVVEEPRYDAPSYIDHVAPPAPTPSFTTPPTPSTPPAPAAPAAPAAQEPERPRVTMVKPVASTEETGPLPVIDPTEPYYPGKRPQPVVHSVDDNGVPLPAEPVDDPFEETDVRSEPFVEVPVATPSADAAEEPAADSPETAAADAPAEAAAATEAPVEDSEPRVSRHARSADDDEPSIFRTGSFAAPAIDGEPASEGSSRHSLEGDEAEANRPSWYVPGKTSKRRRRYAEEDED